VNVKDTVEAIGDVKVPHYGEIKKGSKFRVLAVNEADDIITIDAGDSLPVVPLSWFKVIQEASPKVERLSANKVESPTGSLRYNTGKPQMSLLDPNFMLGMAEVMTIGLEKYGKANWQKGNYLSVPYDSAQRHLQKYWMGQTIDEESSKHHLFHAAVNLMFMYYYENNYPEMDDRNFKDGN
jgi:hypothetical protein